MKKSIFLMAIALLIFSPKISAWDDMNLELVWLDLRGLPKDLYSINIDTVVLNKDGTISVVNGKNDIAATDIPGGSKEKKNWVLPKAWDQKALRLELYQLKGSNKDLIQTYYFQAGRWSKEPMLAWVKVGSLSQPSPNRDTPKHSSSLLVGGEAADINFALTAVPTPSISGTD